MTDNLEVAAEAVRAAIHQSFVPASPGPNAVAALYRSIGETDRLVAMVPQLLRHLAAHADALAGSDQIATDDSTELSGPEAARKIADALTAAAVEVGGLTAGRAASPVADAHSLASTLKFPTWDAGE